VLERGKNLIEFTPIFKVLDQCTCVVVKGRHRVRTRPKLVDGVATPEILNDELHRDEARGDPPLVPGPEIRRRMYGDNPCIASNATNIDEERAEAMAEAQLRKSAREFLTVDGQTIGLPRLRPGFHAEIRGMRPPFDGFYYITKTVHTYGADGLRTKFTGRRPGMPLPPYGEV
jgi:phage protein D